ncbi:MAG: hypothetical protein OXR71_08365, partial [Gemmatimonadota bacterium]|nr:hypothetical protein [Gemmatimonadota bacterium]
LANTTNRERAGLALHFLNTDYIPKNVKATRRYTHLTGPLATGGEKEYGLCVANTWYNEVDRLLTPAPLPL